MLRTLTQQAWLSSSFAANEMFSEGLNFYKSLTALSQHAEALRVLKHLAHESFSVTSASFLSMMKESTDIAMLCDGNFASVLLNGQVRSDTQIKEGEEIHAEVDLTCLKNEPLHHEGAGVIACSYLISLVEDGSKEMSRGGGSNFAICSPRFTLSSLPLGKYQLITSFFSQPSYKRLYQHDSVLPFEVVAAKNTREATLEEEEGPPPSPALAATTTITTDNVGEENTLPIVFFTLVLNGFPFLPYHYPVFAEAASSLSTTFQWHIVEGVAKHRETDWR